MVKADEMQIDVRCLDWPYAKPLTTPALRSQRLCVRGAALSTQIALTAVPDLSGKLPKDN